MPFCYVREGEKSTTESDGGVEIFYQRYGRGKIKVLLIIGLAGTHDGWGPQVKGLTGTEVPNKDEERILMEGGVVNLDGLDEMGKEDGGVEVCCFDNRGMGKSSVPTKKSEYTTTKMAKDALALLDHLGWKKAHVFGHSMGAMIACKLAAVAPDRLCSLALLNVTGGGFQCFPKLDIQMISLAYRFLRAKTPEQRALVDLETHYTKEYLKEHLGTSTRGEMLYHEYAKAISSAGMQSHYGLEGQLNACWTHTMSSKDLDIIRSAGFLVLVLHGRYDIIAQACHARKLAHKLQPAARMVELHGAHLVSHERPEEVNGFLLELIRSSESNVGVQEWSSLLQNEADGLSISVSISLDKKDCRQTNCFVSVYEILAKIWLCVIYFFSLFLVAFEQTRNAYKLLKPARVVASV